jgi:predicted RNA methylase
MNLTSLAEYILGEWDGPWQEQFTKYVEMYADNGCLDNLRYTKKPFQFAYELYKEIVLMRANPQAYYSTPLKVAIKMVKMAEIEEGDIVVDPCAGLGALLKVAQAKGARTFGYETALYLWRASKAIGDAFHIMCFDFLNWPPADRNNLQPNVVLLNPPLGSAQGKTDVTVAFLKRIYNLYGRVSGRELRIIAVLPYGFFGKKAKKRQYSKLGELFDVNQICKIPPVLLSDFVKWKMAIYRLTPAM